MTALERAQRAIPTTVRLGHQLAGTAAAAAETALRLGKIRRGGSAEERRERARRLRDLLARVTALHRVSVEVLGRPPEGPALVAANHVSWLDPLVLGGLFPCVPISKDEVAAWPVIGAMARDLGVLFVERGDARSGRSILHGAARAFADGLAVLNFPEGTTTPGDGVLPFHPALLWMARRAGVPIVPVAISYDRAELVWVGDDTFLPHYARLSSGAPAVARVRFGDPIDPQAYEVSADLACAVRGAVVSLRAA